MFVGVGSLALGDVDFKDVVIPYCSSTFVLTQRIDNYTYTYLDSKSQTLKPAGSSVKPQALSWTLDVSFPLLDHPTYALIENLLGPSIEAFTPFSTLYAKGSTELNLKDGAEARAYNITKERSELVADNGFPDADPTDTIYVVINNGSTEPREFSVFNANNIFSFLGIMYVDNNTYYINVPAMQPSNRINFATGQTPSLSFNIIKLKNRSPFKVYEKSNEFQDLG